MEVRLTSSVHPLVRPTKSGLLNILYGVLEISISLRQPVYFFKFTSGLKKTFKSRMYFQKQSLRRTQLDTLTHALSDAQMLDFFFNTHVLK